MSALGVKSPHLQLLRVNQLSCSNPTSSNTTSLNTQKTPASAARSGAGLGADEILHVQLGLLQDGPGEDDDSYLVSYPVLSD